MTHLTESLIKGKLSIMIIDSQIVRKKAKVFVHTTNLFTCKIHTYFITYCLPYSFALRPSHSLGLLN